MRAAPTLTALGVALATAAAPAAGVGFGRSSNATLLGQPLNFTAALRLDPDESLSRECVSAEVQSGDNLLAPGQVRVALESPTESSERRVRITTRTPIDEPIVTVTLTVGCTAPVTRRFVAFVDPPALNLAQSAPAEPPAAPPHPMPPSAAPLASPPPAAIAIEGGAARAEPPVPRVRRERPRVTADDAAAPPAVRSTPVRRVAEPASAAASESARRGSPRLAAVAPRRPPGPRLQLESGAVAAPPLAPASTVALRSAAPPSAASATSAAAPVVAKAPAPATPVVTIPPAPPAPVVAAAPAPVPAAPSTTSLQPTAAPSTPTASGPVTTTTASAPADTDPLAAERARLRLLEEGLTKLRDESRANEAALASLQMRLQQAESERYGNPLVYGLALLSAVLAGALVALGRRTRRPGGGWWVGKDVGPVPSMYDERAAATPPATVTTAPTPMLPSHEPAPRLQPSARVAAAAPVPRQPPAVGPHEEATRPAPFVSSRLPPAPPAPAPARELSVEELIDLEQQVDFFAVLGQEDAAIALLMSHLRSDGGTSPLPFLKLLEIYRRQGDAASYARVREQFNRRFNAYAPGPEADLAQGRTLADYPATIAHLQRLWASPRHAMEAVDASLFRRYENEATFDLPAYRELLFLYGIARDVAEHEPRDAPDDRGPVDLALPLDEPQHPPIGRLSASNAPPADFQASEMTTVPLDLDVTLGPAPPPGTPLDAETVPSALRRTDNRMFSTESNFLSFDGGVDATRSEEGSRRG